MQIEGSQTSESGSKTIRVALISSVVPSNSSGGGLVLQRHLEQANDVELLVVSDGKVPGFEHIVLKHSLFSRFLKRFMNGPFSKWASDLSEAVVPCNQSQLTIACRKFGPDVVLTVAHGGLARMALSEALSAQVPLVTVFHDWWPDLAGTHRIMKPFLNWRFRQLSRNSTTSLCVCEGMRAALGTDARAKVLFPIPSTIETQTLGLSEEPTEDGPLKVAYMGNLGEYGEMIRLAIEESLNILEVRIEVSGRRTTWDSEFENKVQQLGIWHGFLPDNKLRSWLDSADVFLVAMRFEKQFRRFMETSFPSKILEYAQFHKPIIVWGPKYCSAVRWAQESGAALCVTDPDPSSLVEVLRNLSTEERSQLGSKAGEVAAAEFNPTKIQKQFLNAIENAARVSNSGG